MHPAGDLGGRPGPAREGWLGLFAVHPMLSRMNRKEEAVPATGAFVPSSDGGPSQIGRSVREKPAAAEEEDPRPSNPSSDRWPFVWTVFAPSHRNQRTPTLQATSMTTSGHPRTKCTWELPSANAAHWHRGLRKAQPRGHLCAGGGPLVLTPAAPGGAARSPDPPQACSRAWCDGGTDHSPAISSASSTLFMTLHMQPLPGMWSNDVPTQNE